MRTDILRLDPDELCAALTELSQPAYRARQVYAWLHKGVTDFDDMSNLPGTLRASLAERFVICAPERARVQRSDDGTEKILWRLPRGGCVESVIMQYEAGASLCLSTQVGCRQGCAFCASTLGGLERNLGAEEMLAQLLHCRHDISRLVLMGIGEPLDNFDETLRFLRLLSHPMGRNMSLRHVSLSTCGLVPEIRSLAELGLPVTLSVSLHAANDELRSRLMPVNRQYPLADLLSACKHFVMKTGRRVSYEYVMIDGLNDSVAEAERLAGLLRGHPAHVNLIPLNPVEERSLRCSSPAQIKRFADTLTKRGVNVTRRRTLGADIDAACGQLRRKENAI